jgi:hypothetical protein
MSRNSLVGFLNGYGPGDQGRLTSRGHTDDYYVETQDKQGRLKQHRQK